MEIKPSHIFIVISIFMIGLLVAYLNYYFAKIEEAKIYEETTTEPCSIKHPYGAIGDTCKQFLLNKIDILEQRIEVLEND